MEEDVTQELDVVSSETW